MERTPEKADGRQEESRQTAPEATQLHGKKAAPERIGKVLVAAGGSEQRSKIERNTQMPVKNVNKRVATMSRSELLDLSEKVSVENTTLRQVYETHLVSEQGLRRLMNEYIGGGNIQRALRRELLEHEIDFERDPILRDKAKPDIEKQNSSGGETLQQLLKKANVLNEADTHEELAVLKARQMHHEKQRQQQQKHRRVLDISMVTAIAVLFGLVVVLLLSR